MIRSQAQPQPQTPVPVQELFQPVQPGNLKDIVYARLRAAILGGQIPAGARILEAEIAQAMQVSRAPVREALAHLQQEGLVVSQPNRGSYVAEIVSLEDVHEIVTLRSELESFAVSLAARVISADQLDDLDQLMCDMQAAAVVGDRASVADLDFQFHSNLVRAARHNRLYQVWSQLAAQYWAFYLSGLQSIPADGAEYAGTIKDHHQPIVDALRQGDADVATHYVRRNVIEGSEPFRQAISQKLAGGGEQGMDSAQQSLSKPLKGIRSAE